MIRFIVKRTSYDGNPAGDFVVHYQTIDANMPELESVLTSGGRNPDHGTFDRSEVVGVEVRPAHTAGGAHSD